MINVSNKLSLHDGRIRTKSGKMIDPFNPDVQLINIIDIAHSLSNLCRFTGHCKKFYSVAEHSVLVARHVSKENALFGLLHDATEAYTNDISKPFKDKLFSICPELAQADENLEKMILFSFCGSDKLPDEVKKADKMIFDIEWRNLMMNNEPQSSLIRCLSPEEARKEFLKYFFSIENNEDISIEVPQTNMV